MNITLVSQRPYADELLYSYQARLRAHFVVKSPKTFLAALYGNCSVSASVVYPSRLNRLIENLDLKDDYTAKSLIYQHTLFPLTAPFVPGSRRRMIEQLMSSDNDRGVHVMAGYVASILPKIEFLRCCRLCMQEQKRSHGEPFWLRLHQVAVLQNCNKHQVKLNEVKGTKIGRHRHAFKPLTLSDMSPEMPTARCQYDEVIANQCSKLLQHAESITSPSYSQWTRYYIGLARDLGYMKGKYINYQKIRARVDLEWPQSILTRYNLEISNAQSCWLHSIFRKHRKSFSYLQHIIVNAAFLKEDLDIITCIQQANRCVRRIKGRKTVLINTFSPVKVMENNKLTWLKALKAYSTISARKKFPALYAAVYKYDREWLLTANLSNVTKRAGPKSKVDWIKRDVVAVRAILPIIYDIDNNLDAPKASKHWLLLQLPNKSVVEKYLNKLPLTKKCLTRYAETVSDYQIRRISYQLINNPHPYITRRWFLLRCSGLSEERLTEETRQFLLAIGDSLPVLGRLPTDCRNTKPFRRIK